MPDGRPPFHAALLALALLPVAALAAAPAAADTFHRDTTPLPSDVTSGTASGTAQVASSGGGGTALRLLLGLVVVLGLVFVVRVLLKRSQRAGRIARRGDEVAVVATAPLGGTRAVHLVAVGDELVLVGSAEQGVTALRVYDADEARALLAPAPDAPYEPPSAPGAGRLIDELRRRTAR